MSPDHHFLTPTYSLYIVAGGCLAYAVWLGVRARVFRKRMALSREAMEVSRDLADRRSNKLHSALQAVRSALADHLDTEPQTEPQPSNWYTAMVPGEDRVTGFLVLPTDPTMTPAGGLPGARQICGGCGRMATDQELTDCLMIEYSGAVCPYFKMTLA